MLLKELPLKAIMSSQDISADFLTEDNLLQIDEYKKQWDRMDREEKAESKIYSFLKRMAE